MSPPSIHPSFISFPTARDIRKSKCLPEAHCVAHVVLDHHQSLPKFSSLHLSALRIPQDTCFVQWRPNLSITKGQNRQIGSTMQDHTDLSINSSMRLHPSDESLCTRRPRTPTSILLVHGILCEVLEALEIGRATTSIAARFTKTPIIIGRRRSCRRPCSAPSGRRAPR